MLLGVRSGCLSNWLLVSPVVLGHYYSSPVVGVWVAHPCFILPYSYVGMLFLLTFLVFNTHWTTSWVFEHHVLVIMVHEQLRFLALVLVIGHG